jgi:hypothetical protein
MAVGGFNGTDPAPTLARFKQYVAEGRIHYFVGTGMAEGRGAGSGDAATIAAWVQETYQARTVDGVTLYDLGAGWPPRCVPSHNRQVTIPSDYWNGVQFAGSSLRRSCASVKCSSRYHLRREGDLWASRSWSTA